MNVNSQFQQKHISFEIPVAYVIGVVDMETKIYIKMQQIFRLLCKTKDKKNLKRKYSKCLKYDSEM